MSNEHIKTEQKYQHGSAVLQVAIQLADNSAQTKKTHHFKGTEQASDPLQFKLIKIIR